MHDVQSAWLLLLFCGNSRANYLCRVLDPASTEEYAEGHDANMFRCLLRILEVADDTIQPLWKIISTLPFHAGGMGLRSMRRIRAATYWASWADCLPMIKIRHPGIADEIVTQLSEDDIQNTPLRELQKCAQLLTSRGMFLPSWENLLTGARPKPPPPEEREPGVFQHGWQFYAAKKVGLFM